MTKLRRHWVTDRFCRSHITLAVTARCTVVTRSSQLSRTHSNITVAIVNDALGTLARTVFVVRGKHTVVRRRRADDRAKPDRHIGGRTQPPIPPGRRRARSSIAGVHFVRTQHPVCARLQPDHPGRLSPLPSPGPRS